MERCNTKGNGRAAGGHEFYERALAMAAGSGIPFLVGGAFASERYTGIHRDTKDLDLFLTERDCPALLQVYADRGYRTELTFPHWLGKVYCDDHFVDLIFSSGNGIARVDEEWFAHAIPDEIRGVAVRLVPVEEMIWSKGFVMERERYDGADIAHILHARADRLDWDRLLRRFGDHWRVLLSHLVLFGYVYPQQRHQIPARVIQTLTDRLHAEGTAPVTGAAVCRGTLLSREQYLDDIGAQHLNDARLKPQGELTPAEIAAWTEGIGH